MSVRTNQIVVGYDGSQHSGPAIDWAAAEAGQRQVPLVILHVGDYAMMQGPIGPTPWRPDLIRRAAQRVATEGAERAAKTAASTPISPEVQIGAPAKALIDASQRAALLVIGCRGLGELTGALFGSVAYAVTAHAHSTVIVVPETAERAQHPGASHPVVVGADGSPESDAAVRFAADMAAEHSAPLQIVSAYRSLDFGPLADTGDLTLEADGEATFDSAAREAATQTLAAACTLAGEHHPNLRISGRVADGSAVRILADASRQAALLVVGSRGRGAFTGLLLGSVSHGVLRHAHAPIAVVR